MARLIKKELLSSHTDRETYHLIFDIDGAQLSFKPGDAAAIFPCNDPEEIEKTKAALSFDDPGHLFDDKLSLGKAPIALITLLAQKEPFLEDLLTKPAELEKYIAEHHIWDLLMENCAAVLDPKQIIELLYPLAPRFYSIASSQKADPKNLHLIVATLTYKTNNITRRGVASHFLCYRAKENQTQVPLFIHHTKSFALPSREVPIIMIGAGTGLAPFRAFLQERQLENSSSQNWLFFGERNAKTDFYFKEEFLDLQDRGFLKLDLAFSRDGTKKVYVQNKIYEQKKQIWQWLQKGAGIYVCGNASRMAKDVHKTLALLIEEEGKTNGPEYLKTLIRDKRYARDVY